MKWVCPVCGSQNIVPFYANDKIWVCLDCGYTGPAQLIKDNLDYFWEDYKQIAARKRK